MNIIIRQSNPTLNDCRLIQNIIQTSYPEEELEYTIYNSPKLKYWVLYLQLCQKFRLRMNGHFFYIAELKKKPIGIIQIVKEVDFCHLNNIAVLPEYQNKGVGSMLFKKFLEFADEQSSKILSLDVSLQNEKAYAFYKKNGFKGTTKMFIYKFNVTPRNNNRKLSILNKIFNFKALIQYTIFGFCNFKIKIGKQTFILGKLGQQKWNIIEVNEYNENIFKFISNRINSHAICYFKSIDESQIGECLSVKTHMTKLNILNEKILVN